MNRYSVAPYNEQDSSGVVRHIFCRFGFSSGQAQVAVVSAKDRIPEAPRLVEMLLDACPELTSIVLNVNKTRGNTVFGGQFRTLWGEDGIMDSLCGLNFKLSARSFYQVNHAQAQNLYNRTVELADLHGSETVFDLYCGTGTITLCLAAHAKTVIGAEIVPEAIADAKENAARNGVENASFICADAFKAAAQLEQDGILPDVVVVDPPRKGLAGEVIELICSMAPKRVVYVSCDPATLARDIKIFSSFGYFASHAEAFDMFPHTNHVESIALLCREAK
jgi:23S rRNA (uracil1939-C5)-methyltransferase